MANMIGNFGFWMQVVTQLGIPLFNQLRELLGPSVPTIEQLKEQSGAIWAKIAEEEGKV
jgi:hypothetical protein